MSSDGNRFSGNAGYQNRGNYNQNRNRNHEDRNRFSNSDSQNKSEMPSKEVKTEPKAASSETSQKTFTKPNDAAANGQSGTAKEGVKTDPAVSKAGSLNNDPKRKFTGRCRLFFGNIPVSLSEEEFVNIIKPYGETEDLFLNAKKGFGFVKLETRAAAEACKNGLDGIELQNRSLRVRFATHSAALHVKNLSQHCTNESLEQAFSYFGPVERAVVVVDDRGKPQGTGIVEFSRRASYLKALETISKGVFLLSKSMRPVCVEPLEQKDEEDGLPEKYAQKNQEWFDEMSVDPRLAEPGSFEYDVGMKWKDLEKVEQEKKRLLEDEMAQKRLEMEIEVETMMHDHKANMLRQDMMRRQAELNALEMQKKQREEQKMRELEMRRMQLRQQQGNQMNMGGPNMNMGGPNMNMGGPNQMGGAGPMNRMNRPGPNAMQSGGRADGGEAEFPGGQQPGGFNGGPQELLMQHQQQALRERIIRERQAALQEMQGRQQQHGGRSLQPPPNPPPYLHEGRNSGGNGGSNGGRRMGGGDNFRGPRPGPKEDMHQSRFEQGSARNGPPRGGGPHGAPSLLGPNPQRPSLNNYRQHQGRMFNQQGMGPADAKRPRRY